MDPQPASLWSDVLGSGDIDLIAAALASGRFQVDDQWTSNGLTYTPLGWVLHFRTQNLQVVKLLLRSRATVERTSCHFMAGSHRYSPLGQAIVFELNCDILTALLDYGASPTAPFIYNGNQYTPESFASQTPSRRALLEQARTLSVFEVFPFTHVSLRSPAPTKATSSLSASLMRFAMFA
jgi:hypothetical protein